MSQTPVQSGQSIVPSEFLQITSPSESLHNNPSDRLAVVPVSVLQNPVSVLVSDSANSVWVDVSDNPALVPVKSLRVHARSQSSSIAESITSESEFSSTNNCAIRSLSDLHSVFASDTNNLESALVLRRESAVDPVEKSEITAWLVKYRDNDQSQIDTLHYEREVNHFLQALHRKYY